MGWKRPEEFVELLDTLDGNDFWELAHNEGGEQAAMLCEALDLLDTKPDDMGQSWRKRRDALIAWAATATGYGDEPEDT